MDNSVGIDCGSGVEGWAGQGRAMEEIGITVIEQQEKIKFELWS